MEVVDAGATERCGRRSGGRRCARRRSAGRGRTDGRGYPTRRALRNRWSAHGSVRGWPGSRMVRRVVRRLPGIRVPTAERTRPQILLAGGFAKNLLPERGDDPARSSYQGWFLRRLFLKPRRNFVSEPRTLGSRSTPGDGEIRRAILEQLEQKRIPENRRRIGWVTDGTSTWVRLWDCRCDCGSSGDRPQLSPDGISHLVYQERPLEARRSTA